MELLEVLKIVWKLIVSFFITIPIQLFAYFWLWIVYLITSWVWIIVVLTPLFSVLITLADYNGAINHKRFYSNLANFFADTSKKKQYKKRR